MHEPGIPLRADEGANHQEHGLHPGEHGQRVLPRLPIHVQVSPAWIGIIADIRNISSEQETLVREICPTLCEIAKGITKPGLKTTFLT